MINLVKVMSHKATKLKAKDALSDLVLLRLKRLSKVTFLRSGPDPLKIFQSRFYATLELNFNYHSLV